jgi:Fe-S cluster assembly protein SufB
MTSIESQVKKPYQYGWETDIESDTAPAGLSEDTIRLISKKKDEPEWLLEWRLKAYRHWLTMKEPKWANIHYGPIDYQGIHYYAAPKKKPGSMNEVDPEIRAMYDRLGIPLQERAALAGVAVDAVLDSVSVATTFKEKLSELGIIFGSFSDAVREHPDLVRKWLGSVVPFNDNFFAALNSAVFSDGSFAYVPPGVRCPMELSTYFRINAQNTGQFERTLIIADSGAYVSYLEGCLPDWEEVSTGEALVPVRSLALHDTVLNGDGREGEVSKLMQRVYSGDLVEITPRSTGNRFAVTTEHPVLAVRRERVRRGLRTREGWPEVDAAKLKAAEPEFVPASDLRAGDYLVFPINKVSRDDPTLTDDFLALLGYYVAEGCATKLNGCDAVELSFGSHEKATIRRACELIEKVTGKRPSVTYDWKRHGAYVVVYSKELSQACVEHGGKYAIGKRFSKAVMDLPPERQRIVLETYIEGDGCVEMRPSHSGRLRETRTCTVSRQLAFQTQELIARQGIYACINTQEASDETMRDGHIVRHKKRYWVIFHENTRSHPVKRRDGYFLVPIRRVARHPYSGMVYNFETEGDPHTYLVKGFAVHNCTAPMRDENQLHAAVVELIALDDGEVKYSTIQNWYPGDKNGKGGIYNFVTKRGKALGRNSKISWTQVETGSAITWKYPSCILQGDNSVGEFYSVAVVNNHQQADTGTKMLHIGKNTRSTIISKGISAGLGQNTYRGRVQIHKGAVNARNYSQCDSLLLGDKCGAHTFPDIEVNEPTAQLEHEASTSKIGDDQLFYCQQRGITPEDATNMIVNGFCKKVFLNLPMEFAVEAQKLLAVSLNLEGTVG